MNDGDIKNPVFIFSIAFLCMMWGMGIIALYCSEVNTPYEDFKGKVQRYEQVCEQNEGVKSIELHGTEVICNNGAMFHIDEEELK